MSKWWVPTLDARDFRLFGAVEFILGLVALRTLHLAVAPEAVLSAERLAIPERAALGTLVPVGFSVDVLPTHGHYLTT